MNGFGAGRGALLGGLLVIMAGCSGGKETRTSIEDLRGEVLELRRKVVETNTQIEDLNNRINVLRTLIERGQVGRTSVPKAEEPRPERRPPAPVPAPEVQPVPEEHVPRTVDLSSSLPQEQYAKAMADYEAGRYDLAIVSFDAFVRAFPDHEFVSNALYWTGECYYDKKEYLLAIHQFNKVVEKYKNGQKAPDALLKTAFCQLHLENTSLAEKLLRRLLAEYPTSVAAGKARERLNTLKGN